MEKEDKKNSIEELFKSKIEESEIEPGEELTTHFMHRLWRREFLRFNIYRFNIWYTGAIAIVATFISVAILSGNQDTEEKTKQPEYNLIADSAGTVTIDKQSGKDSDLFVKPVKKDLKSMSDTPKTDFSSTTPENKEGAVKKKFSKKNNLIKEKGSNKLFINASVIRGCVPLPVRFSCTSPAEESFTWSFGDGGTSSEREPDWVFNVAGLYNVTLNAKDENNTFTSASIDIEVLPKPEAAFEISPSDPVIPKDEIRFINTSLGAKSFQWHFGDGTTSDDVNPVHKYLKSGKYDISIVAVSAFGCVDSLSVSDAFSETECYLRFPNAFTPDKNGPCGGYYSALTSDKNVVFHPVSAGVTRYNLKIYNQQGFLVFETDDILIGWDGCFKGTLCTSGVYIWKAEGKFRNGKSYVLTGDVTLVNY